MTEMSNRKVPPAEAVPLKDLAVYQDRSVVSREVINKPSGTVTVFATV